MIKIKLKSLEDIEKTFRFDKHGKPHTSGIGFDYDKYKEYLNFKGAVINIEFYRFKGEYCFKYILSKSYMYVHPDWISNISYKDIVFDKMPKKLYNNFSILAMGNNIFIDKANPSKLLEAKDVNKCDSCKTGYKLKADTICSRCLRDLYFDVKTYDFEPSKYIFYDVPRKNTKNNIWYGIELEYGINNLVDVAKLCYNYKEVYLKEDDSIIEGKHGGVEIVSHPMSYDYIVSEASYINSLKDISVVDDSESREDNAMHIHLSRSSYTTDNQYNMMYNLLETIVSNKKVQYLWGRPLNKYCSIDETIEHDDDERVCKDTLTGNYKRNVWCNCSNHDTIEYRFFSSSTDRDIIIGRIQLIDSMLNYTILKDINNEDGYIFDYIQYLFKNQKKYNELFNIMFIENNFQEEIL